MDNFTEIPQYFWIVLGLVLDIFGFVLLGIDLLRLQYDIKKRANENISIIDEFSEKYGGIQNWSRKIHGNIEHIRDPSPYIDKISEDLSENTRGTVEGLKGLNQCVKTLEEHLSDFVKLFEGNVEKDREAANKSVFLSWFGLGFVVLGFVLQIIGVLAYQNS